MNYIKGMLFTVGLATVGLCNAGSIDVVSDGRMTFSQTCEQLKKQELSESERAALNDASNKVKQSAGSSFTEQELITALDVLIKGFDNKLTPETIAMLDDAKDALIRRLRNFNVTGFAVAFDPNGAFFWDTQDPEFDMIFKNAAGEVKHRRIQADIESIGLKVEFALNINIIFFIGTDLNYFDTVNKVNLGTGVEFTIAVGPGITITYAPFRNASGALFMTTLGFGLKFPSLSVVTGGNLSPVAASN